MRALLFLGACFGLLVLARARLAPVADALLLVWETFPHLPFKPLSRLTPRPVHRHVQLSPQGPVVADLLLPTHRIGTLRARSVPAVILCVGVKTQEWDRKVILHLAESFARLGYVAIWPRLAPLDRGASLLEEPATFVTAFRYLEAIEIVDPARISLLGFSVGSSIALVAATDGRIADRVRALFCFGGYYDIFGYLRAIATGAADCDGHIISWKADDGARTHIRDVLQERQANQLLGLLEATTPAEAERVLQDIPPHERAVLQAVSPAGWIDRLRTRVFVLHDRGDRYVPYCESVKLSAALGSRVSKRILIVNLFEHTQPARILTRATAHDFARLFAFLTAAFDSL